MSKPQWDFRDISKGLKILRDFLLGRKHNLHGRFAPVLAPRTIPPPDIPRAMVYKYSDQYYYNRNSMHSVMPPVVAPVAEGPPVSSGEQSQKPKPGGLKPDEICFFCAPTPGATWWWDGHCYYECQPDSSQPQETNDPCAKPPA